MSHLTPLLCNLGLRLLPLIIKTGLAILGIASRQNSSAPALQTLCPSLMAFCPQAQALSGVIAFFSMALQTALRSLDVSALIAWPIRIVLFAASALGQIGFSSLTSCHSDQICSCALSFLLNTLHSALLHHLLATFLLP